MKLATHPTSQQSDSAFAQESNVPPTDLAHLNQLRCHLLTQKSQAGTADPNVPELHSVAKVAHCLAGGRTTLSMSLRTTT